ncbi:MAG: 2OG-Fe(II) oxygenase [Alphaproteobacteria bacterium]|nr:2OG-Fe(II) oxygenase [Alphaproteobacteria bacterium]
MQNALSDIIDLDRYPLHVASSDAYRTLCLEKQRDWQQRGAFSLPGLIQGDQVTRAVAEIIGKMETSSFRHKHHHNIYFTDDTDALPDDIAALSLTTSHRTLTCDQLAGSIIRAVYEWPALCDFIRTVMGVPALYPMADPMAGLNVMAYGDGEGLNWHFDRAKFAVTILLQAPADGGQFEFHRGLRTAQDPNFEGIRRLLSGQDDEIQQGRATPGTMTVFAGYGSAHRVAPVIGSRPRIMAVLSYMEEPDYYYCAEDRIRFYGRARPEDAITATS